VLAQYPARNEALINAGGTALHKDSGGAGVKHWGELRGTSVPVIVSRISQEHGIVSTPDGSPLPWDELAVGALVRIVPNHSCMTACMHEIHHVVDSKGSVVDAWRPARGW
jgi:D-serine deaminase-like pyridoxal phosphate-dependent protein